MRCVMIGGRDFPRTEKIEEFLLAWMHPVLEHQIFN
jgi:hypothetical protein